MREPRATAGSLKASCPTRGAAGALSPGAGAAWSRVGWAAAGAAPAARASAATAPPAVGRRAGTALRLALPAGARLVAALRGLALGLRLRRRHVARRNRRRVRADP